MKQKELEIILQKVPIYEQPNPYIEQYMTPANIAADIIFTAYGFGDIQDKKVIDLGCGTGIFSFGAKYANAKKVIGIDIDEECIKIAKNYAEKNNEDIQFIIKDVKDLDIKCNTVIMNPPFGAQKSNRWADRRFIEKGFEIAKVIYSLHLTKTLDFIEKMILALGGEINFYKKYDFSIKHSFSFHSKKALKFDVTLLKILTKR
ncbi:MAG: methyltransferase [Thermoplasmatales archaeon]|nr:methyltransferase [Thermoplasmatales archaeon]MCK4995574.1 methyltransferase [Thermoplasmatales archaeon]MCK5636380.1 methyltransferase [Thermoplasmatales archaeon]